jgi:hypothetical protein
LKFKYSLQQNEKLREFVASDDKWLRLILLLYGGIKAQQENTSPNAKIAFEFDFNMIHRDSILSERLLSALRAKQSSTSLLSDLESLFLTSTNSTEQFHALLAMIALGSPIPPLSTRILSG